MERRRPSSLNVLGIRFCNECNGAGHREGSSTSKGYNALEMRRARVDSGGESIFPLAESMPARTNKIFLKQQSVFYFFLKSRMPQARDP
jgi:hypothetical protein